ncbi:MAG: thymidylate synthase [uncultured bacterium]|nr:MAG: thymidylate synthase [uncultured bacterium]HBR71483.1 thymidylate synthase [Candidatus Moranbacteria bacterium]
MKNEKHSEYQYLDLMREIIENGAEQVDAGTGVKTYSLFGRQLRFDLNKGFPLLTTKRVYWKGVLQELYWFVSGQSNIKYLVDNNVHIWDDYPYRIYREKIEKGTESEMTKEEFIQKIKDDNEFAKKHGNLSHVYGDMWRHWPASNGRKIDQLQWIINNVRKDKSTHSALLTAWNPEFLYEMAAPGQACRFPICHNMFQINVNNGKLSLQLYQRSADIFLGVPFNIASYSLLAMILAQITGNKFGEFVLTFGDVHIYEDHFDAAKEQLKREPYDFPKVKIDDSIKEIDDFTPEKVELVGYKSYETIKASLSPTGGIVDKTWKKFVQDSKKNLK